LIDGGDPGKLYSWMIALEERQELVQLLDKTMEAGR
jgi:hypothetical protein